LGALLALSCSLSPLPERLVVENPACRLDFDPAFAGGHEEADGIRLDHPTVLVHRPAVPNDRMGFYG
jgi:hypothetical protein